MLEQLEIQEKDLNRELFNNVMPSKSQISSYVKKAVETKKALQDKYGEMWTVPQ